MFDASVLGFVVGRWSRSLPAAAGLGLLDGGSAGGGGRDPGPGGDRRGHLDSGSRVSVGHRPGRRSPAAVGGSSSTPPGASSPSRRCSPSGGASHATSTTCSATGSLPSCCTITSARHVLRRDPAAAEEALRSAEDLGRRSMRELRGTVALLRSDEDRAVAPSRPDGRRDPGARRAGAGGGPRRGELRVQGDLARIAPGVGVAVYRIAQEALANAARHAPQASTVLGVELDDGAGLSRRYEQRAGCRPRWRAPAVRVRAGRDARASNGARRGVRRWPDRRRLAGALPAPDGGKLRAPRGRSSPMIRVALVDDQAIVRAGLARILSPEDGFEVVAECGDGRRGRGRAARLSPDVVLMDIRMPRASTESRRRRSCALSRSACPSWC